MPAKILVLHGPNVNLLGQRPGDDPSWSLQMLDDQIRDKASSLGANVKIFQSNHEGELIDRIHSERQWADGIVLNPGALAHTSYALRDAIASVAKPTFEVHMSDILRREPWRRKSVLKDVCLGQIVGRGIGSYLLALEKLCRGTKSGASTSKVIKKTVGRRAATAPSRSVSPAGRKPAKVAGPLSPKTIGRQPVASRDAEQVLTRVLIRQKIADRLAGKITPAALATWARSKWIDVERGAPAESGQREVLADSLQSLLLSTASPARLTDEQLIDLMTQLEG